LSILDIITIKKKSSMNKKITLLQDIQSISWVILSVKHQCFLTIARKNKRHALRWYRASVK